MELKNTLKVIGISLLGVLGVGMSCYSHSVGMTLLAPSYEKASAYSVNEYQESVTFTKEELNNCSYPYLDNDLLSGYSNYSSFYCIYNNLRFEFSQYEDDQFLEFAYQSQYNIRYVFDGGDGYLYKFFLNVNLSDDPEDPDYDTIDFEYSLTIYSNFFAENMQKSVNLSANQLNNNTYQYLANKLNDESFNANLTNTYITYNNNIYTYSDNDGETIQYNASNGYFIIFSYIDNYKWYANTPNETNFNNSITIYSTWFADNIYAPNQPVNLLTAIVGLLTGGITGIASGVGSGVSTLTSQIFIVDNALSVFGGMIVLFAGISLAIGLCRWIMQFLTSLGAKK